MFETISEKFSAILSPVRDSEILTEESVDKTLKAVRMSLLEADVNFRVAGDFVEAVRKKAVGSERRKGLTAGQQFVQTVQEELTRFLGAENRGLERKGGGPLRVMAVGLQGAGKTTFCAKLAALELKNGAKPLLVPADVYRPAAAEQLATLARAVGAQFFEPPEGAKPEEICALAGQSAAERGVDTVIFDTAGRLHIDAGLMEELRRIDGAAAPGEILLVADAMSGQDAVRAAEGFAGALNISGVVLTKMDGDARGGAALSIRAVTGKPVKFFSTGEKPDDLELFHPERIASRILGMGDMLTLIEKAQVAFSEKEAEKIAKRAEKNRFTLEDFRKSITALEKMGPVESLAAMVPGAGALAGKSGAADKARRAMKTGAAIVDSMTPRERRDHRIINSSRRKRIARGSGTTVAEVDRTIKNFIKMRSVMKKGGGMKTPPV